MSQRFWARKINICNINVYPAYFLTYYGAKQTLDQKKKKKNEILEEMTVIMRKPNTHDEKM